MFYWQLLMKISLVNFLREKLGSWLRKSPHVHVRGRNVNNLAELVDLLDRFVDGDMEYDLEWDDFISWEQDNKYIESVREKIGGSEEFLFSKNIEDRKKYVLVIVSERNKVAALIGVSPRDYKFKEGWGNR